MRPRLIAVLGGTVLTLAMLVGGAAGAAASPASSAPTPGPAPTCPPVLPLSGAVSAATARSLTISYSIFLAPPCGYHPPVTVTLFARPEDARQWADPVAEAVSGPERSGKVTIDGLTPGTDYWFRFTADGKRDPYVVGSARTATTPACAATVTISSAWSGGFVAAFTVRNVSAEALDAWRVSWRWAGDERIVSLWNGVAQDGGDGVTIGNASYNGALPPGGSTSFGLLVAAGTPPGDLTPACTR